MKLILTKELGRLAKWLRILGVDAEYFSQDNLNSLIVEALRDERIILTRNQRLSKHAGMKIILVKAQKVKEQTAEILKALNIRVNKDIMFSRCVICNLALVPVDKEKIKDKVPEYVFKTQVHFTSCPKCRRIYWPGTHWGNVQKTLEEINGIHR